ncbi:glucose-induced degradation protein 8 homolog [Anopheles moucheti]|uniref:glucose-induced degradation protein 8 homolog n=1 Tax=Anopheles moucheti TaxID=186751 RepID=UPI0022F121DB|nr:glucose-induced degradation protein 8 homolog [Anopheles moucheti]
MDQPPRDKSPTVEEWDKLLQTYTFRQENIHRLVANYFVRSGYKEALETFTQESYVNATVSPRSLNSRVLIVEAIRKGNGLEAYRLMETFFPDLLATCHLLTFQLLQLHIIELIRTGSIEEALLHAQTLPYLIAQFPPEVTNEIGRTLTLLIFEDPLTSPYGELLQQSHRDKVACAVNEAIFRRTNPEISAATLEHLCKMVFWSQEQLSKGKVRFIAMKNIATATLELE